MKVKSATTSRASSRGLQGFTLIEMIGVLAVIAILAAVLVPKVFEAINNARINNSSMSCDTVKTAIADHYAKAGSLNADDTTGTPVVISLATPFDGFDKVLMKEQFLDKPFAVKIGDGIATNNTVRLKDITGYALAATVDGTDTTGFALSGGTTNTAVGSVVVEAVIGNVTAADAQALSTRIDGVTMTETALTTPDTQGRVKYATPVGGVTTVYVYLTHR